ncbi:MAG: LysM peptidoglycan-binding domain-containing protein [Anaerolineae bacterium]|nr:LysM peptidoglycan-binding domain-containing protein [Anaerolineae bacterium]
MTRKSISLVFLVLLALSVILGGCKPRKAADDFTPMPTEDESATAVSEALTNTLSLTSTPNPEQTQAPTVEPTTPAATAAATEAPTPAATAAATEAPTPAATAATTVTTTEAVATITPVTSSTPGKHIVQPNENLYRIALRYGTTPQALAEANGITNPALIFTGQELTIPSGGSGTTTLPPTGGASGGGTYMVQAGDNLFRIALKYNYDQYYLARYNGISNPALIYPGQVIRIPSD